MTNFSWQYTYKSKELEKFFAVDNLLNFLKYSQEEINNLSENEKENILEVCKTLKIIDEN